MPYKDPEKKRAATRAAMQRKRDRDRNPGPGRPRKRSAAPVAAPRAKGPPGLTPASVGGPAPPPPLPLPKLEDIEEWTPEDARRNLTWIAQFAPREGDRVSASRALLTWREKTGGGDDGDADRVPPELVALWNDPTARRMLERVVAAQRGAA